MKPQLTSVQVTVVQLPVFPQKVYVYEQIKCNFKIGEGLLYSPYIKHPLRVCNTLEGVANHTKPGWVKQKHKQILLFIEQMK